MLLILPLYVKDGIKHLKTPEGTFYVSDKSTIDPPDYYLGSRWLGVSYPNIEDAERGLKKRLDWQADI